MQNLYDELDANGNIVAQGIMLQPGIALTAGHKWVPHKPTLESLKYSKRSEIEQYRDISCFKSVEAIGYIWQADKRSQELLTSAILFSQINPELIPKIWRTANNIDVNVTLDDLKEIAKAISLQTSAAYTKSWQLKEAVNKASTEEELAAISWR